MRIYCLMSGCCLTDRDREILMYAAMHMARDKIGRKSLKGENFEGEITTDFESADLGGIGGMRFSAKLETDVGERRVDFLVRTRDLEGIEKGHWVSIVELLEIMERNVAACPVTLN